MKHASCNGTFRSEAKDQRRVTRRREKRRQVREVQYLGQKWLRQCVECMINGYVRTESGEPFSADTSIYIHICVCVYDLVLVCFLTLNVYFTADVCFHCRSFLAIQCQHQGSKEDPAYLKWRAQQDKRNRVKQSKRAQYSLKLKTASRHRSIFWRIAIALLRCQQPRQAHQGIQEIPQRGSRKSHFWTRVWRTLPRHRDRRRGTDEKNHTNSLHHLHSCWFHVESHAFCDTRSR